MKPISRLLFAVALLVSLAHARFIPDPIVRYRIDARLDAKTKMIQGHEIIVWRNHTNDAIPDLQFHLYLNAFKNDYSTFMREGGAESRRVKFQDKAESWGYEQVRGIKVDGSDLTGKIEYIQPDDGNPDDQTVMRVVLPKPISPQGSATIEIDWTSKLPHVFARTGFHDNFFLVAQWFPKPGVYEGPGDRHRKVGGWNCHQFHTATEFYADYGVFDVNLTVPSGFEIAATGANRHEHTNPDGTTTYNFYQEDVHDFAWTTQPRSQVLKLVRWFNPDERVTSAEYREWAAKTGTPFDEMKLTPVKVTLFIQREHAAQADRHFRAAFAGLKWFGLMYGRYPYDVLTVVDPPFGGGGASGMEYPTFFTAGTQYWQSRRGGSPEGVTVHEFGHQFWYGLVGNNEFEEAWLDEGFNSYSTTRTLQLEYGKFYNYERVFGVPLPGESWVNLPVPAYPWHGVGEIGVGQYWEWVPRDWYRSRLGGYLEHAQSDPMERFAWQTLDVGSYRDQAYSKPELTLHTLEALLGDSWPKVIRAYQLRWRFKHPDAQDFMDTVREVSGRDMKWFFDQTAYGTGLLNYAVSFSSGPAPARHGFFDKDGKPALADSKDEGPVESEVLVRRVGEMQFPVTVLVHFADGSRRREQWDGGDRWHKFKFTGTPKIVSADIDPDFLWKLEAARVDNSYLAQPVKLAAEKWYLRWVVWLQNVFMAFSYFA
jgi:hypothetical protein